MRHARILKTHRSFRGFTLVELMITLVVAAVLIGIAVPSFTALASNTRLENKANELFGMLKQTRHNAIVTGNWSFICRTNKAVNNVNSGGASCRLAGLSARDWANELMVYTALPDTVIPTPNATFNNLRIQALGTGNAMKKQMLQNVREAPAGNITVASGVNNNVVAFDRTGALVNVAPFRFAICDDRTDPEDFGRIIEINQAGQVRLYKTDATNTNKDCTPTGV